MHPLLNIGLSQAAPIFPTFGFSHPVDACHFSEVGAPSTSSCGAPDTPFTDTRFPLEDPSSPSQLSYKDGFLQGLQRKPALPVFE
ncbi:jg26970 [Pararge aegeria aegeria]|uniref:Jg26970 protein n=1 Tax=Pararge aegeria aegeria TaxID=348720 RepID=A0A8S4S1C3_9NEOP|nr:jg26970 [Pararge aegeria aegeria]